MARPLRIEFPGAIYHVMSRGNARRAIFHDAGDYQQLIDGLATVVTRLEWDLISFVLMPNHLHLLVRTPRPNLSRGMQHLISGYANWQARRRQRPGHTFQGRFKSQLIEDESYFWTVSRYLHLNPVRGKRPLAAHPRDWPWSSYPGYNRASQRVKWVAYDELYSAWRGEMGGKDPAAAYRRFVEQGLVTAPANPFQSAAHGWLLGSEAFRQRIRKLVSEPRNPDEVPAVGHLTSLEPATVLAEVARYYSVDPDRFHELRSGELARDVAAWLARRRTIATLRELAPAFGLSHPDSVSNLIRRVDRALATSSQLRKDIAMIERFLESPRTENRA
ncbi:MAG: transposase [Isosphaeraceae bacterium]